MATRVLYVDGDPGRRERTAARIERAGSVRVTACGEPGAALDRLAVRPVDCVVTVCTLPGWTGAELAAAVARVAPAVPVVVSAEPDGPPAAKLEAAADAFCRRPAGAVPVEALLDRIDRVTSQTERSSDPAADATDGHQSGEATDPDRRPATRGTASNAHTSEEPGRPTADGAGQRATDAGRPDPTDTRSTTAGASDGHPPEVGEAAADAGANGEPTESPASDQSASPASDQSESGVSEESPSAASQSTSAASQSASAAETDDSVAGSDRQRPGASNGRLDGLAGNAPWPVALTTLDGEASTDGDTGTDGESSPRVQAVNAAFEETFGHDAATVAGEPLDEFVVPDGEEAAAAGLNRAASDGEAFSVEVERLAADGVRPFLLTVVPGDTADERWAVYADVGDRIDREERVRRLHEVALSLSRAEEPSAIHRETATAAADLLPADRAVVYTDDEGRLERVAAADDEPAGPPGHGVVGEVFEAGEGQLVTDRGAGEPADGDAATVAVPVGDRGVLRVGADETDRFDKFDLDVANLLAAHAATALDRTTREAALARREAQLERQNDRLERFAGLVSHDLRTPLEVARGNVELGMLDDDEERLTAAIDALDRADDLIDDMLTFARTGEHVTNESTVHVGEVAREAWTPEFDAVGDLTVATGRAVTADEDRLRQLFENLYRNAVEHGRETGEEAVRVRVVDTHEGFAVEDDGPGLPDTAGDLFDPGVSTADDGTGFGLSLVQEIAAAHGWSVTARSPDASDATEADDEAYGGARFEVQVGETLDDGAERGVS